MNGPLWQSRQIRIAAAWVLPLLAILAMQLLAGRDSAPRYLVAPTQIAHTLWELVQSGELFRDSWASLRRAYAGFFLGSAAGILIGLLCSVSRPLNAFFDPLVSMLYPVPKVALLPILITWLGFGDASKIALISVAVFFPTFINALYGARDINPRLLWSARNMGAGRAQIFFKVIVPAVSPHLFNGLRLGLALSLIVLFAAEMVGAHDGLGNLILKAEEGLRFDLMYAAIFSIGVIGFASDRLLQAIRRKLLGGKFPGETRHG